MRQSTFMVQTKATDLTSFKAAITLHTDQKLANW